MCGRFTLRTPLPVLIDQFQIALPLELPPRYNVAPTQDVATVCADAEGRREMRLMQWGLIPFWAKDPKIGNRMINARAETVAEKPAFRKCFERRRCLVLADGYFEWRKEGSKKQPYHIHLKDQRPFALAGLWDRWRPAADQALESCTVITTDANALTRPIHDRMPVILDEDQYEQWLDPNFRDTKRLLRLLDPLDSDRMAMEAVSTRVNSPRNDDAACLEPAEQEA